MSGVYSSGSASSFEDLRDAIRTFVTANGFTEEAGLTTDEKIIKKSPINIKMESNADYLKMTAGVSVSGSDLVDPSLTVMLVDPDLTPISFPINYEFYLFPTPDEFYCIINYNGSRYQHINFGVSNVPDIGGNKVWLTGMCHGSVNYTDATYMKVFITSYRNANSKYFDVEAYAGYGLGYFLNNESGSYGSSGINCGLEGSDDWRIHGYNSGNLNNTKDKAQLMDLPSLFNEGDTLLPIRGILRRVSGTNTIVAELVNARLCRLDNRAPGDTVVFGSDSWKLYPLFTKNTAERNGKPWATGALHSGTFGVAIKVPS